MTTAIYRIRAPRTGEPWTLYKVSDDSYEYPIGYARVWSRLARLAHAIFEVAFVPVDDEEAPIDSYALLYRFVWPY